MAQLKTIIVAILLYSFVSVSGQDLMNLPLESGIWKQEHVTCTNVSSVVNNETVWNHEYKRHYFNVFSTNDTIIKGLSYSIINNSDFGISGVIRQVENLVYYKHFGEEGYWDEVILYDFNVQEKFVIHTVWGEEVAFSVINIDTINVNGINRKRIEFEDEAFMFIGKYWIEGIGSSGGLLKPFYPTDIPTCESCCGVEEHLVCLQENDELLYLKDNYFDCDSVISSIQYLKERIEARIWVASEVLHIETNNGNRVTSVEIYNQGGKLIFKDIVNQLNKIKIKKKLVGLNIVKVYTDKGVLTKKIVMRNKY